MRATGFPPSSPVVPKPGRIGLAYFADDKGPDRHGDVSYGDRGGFLLPITAATAQWHDYEWLLKLKPVDAAFVIEDVTEAFSRQILTGPYSRAILADVTDADLFPPVADASVGANRRALVPVGARFLAGELGWEIHTRLKMYARCFRRDLDGGKSHGLKPFAWRRWTVSAWKGLSRLEGRSFDRLHRTAGWA